MKKMLLSFLVLVSSVSYAKIYNFISDRSSDEVKVGDVSLSGHTGLDVNFHLKSMETEDLHMFAPLKSFQKLKFESLSTTKKTGEVSLPFYSVIVADRPENLLVSYHLGERVLLNDVTPAPSPRLNFRNETYKEDYSFLNVASFRKSSSKLYEIEYLGDFRGTPLTKVTFYPAKYNGATEFSVFPKAQFSLVSKKKSVLDNMSAPENLLAGSDVNNRYLVITPKRFIESLKTFLDWKKENGYDVSVFALEDIGSTADVVRTFIQNRYKDSSTKFSWTLLVGTESIFPTFYKPTSSSSKTPSDLPYFTMGGSSDTIADVFYGRLVVSTEQDIINQVKKMMDYEKGNFADASGYSRAVGIASDEGANPSDVDYVKMMAKPFEDNFSMTFSYHFQAENTATVEKISSALNAGAVWVNYVGHGSGYAWASTNDNFNTGAVKALQSEQVKPVIIDVACMNGKFQKGYFGERFMNEVSPNGAPIGASVYYGGSVNVSWHPPAIMAKGINIKVVEEKVKTIGEAVFAGQMFLNATYTGNKKDVVDNMTWYHLFGDPTMNLHMKP